MGMDSFESMLVDPDPSEFRRALEARLCAVRATTPLDPADSAPEDADPVESVNEKASAKRGEYERMLLEWSGQFDQLEGKALPCTQVGDRAAWCRAKLFEWIGERAADLNFGDPFGRPYLEQLVK